MFIKTGHVQKMNEVFSLTKNDAKGLNVIPRSVNETTYPFENKTEDLLPRKATKKTPCRPPSQKSYKQNCDKNNGKRSKQHFKLVGEDNTSFGQNYTFIWYTSTRCVDFNHYYGSGYYSTNGLSNEDNDTSLTFTELGT